MTANPYPIKKALVISGGAFKISFLTGVCTEAIKSTLFDVFVGTSSGAIVAFCIATGKVTELIRRVLSFGVKEVFKQSPTSKRGKLRALWRVLRGKEYHFDQSKLLDTLKSVVSEEDFNKYKDNPSSPPCYVGVAEKGKLKSKYINLKLLNYEQACLAVLASCSIPNATKEVFLNGEFLVDGGFHEHIGSHWLLEKYGKTIDEITCVYSRPNEEWLDENYCSWKSKKAKWFSFNWIKDLINSYEDAQLSNSLDEEKKTMFLADSLGIKVNNIFAPNLLSTELYKATNFLNLNLPAKVCHF
jgi:predicted patatin/cPLA2 family phospholipase